MTPRLADSVSVSPSLPLQVAQPPAEFDAYAADYDGGMDNAIKRWAGDSAVEFIDVKVRWLLNELARRPLASPRRHRPRVLDFGCGVGTFLARLRWHGFGGKLRGCDVSAEMLARAEADWEIGPVPAFDCLSDSVWPYADDSFDMIIACCVFHHVPLAERGAIYGQFARILAPGGRVYIFEHNPFNPATQWVVRQTPIDQNAVLLRAGEARQGLRAVGLEGLRQEAMLFVPPRWRRLSQCERWLRWLPLGGQYVVVGEKRRVLTPAIHSLRLHRPQAMAPVLPSIFRREARAA
jgi:SAM-dependent methyltransferase